MKPTFSELQNQFMLTQQTIIKQLTDKIKQLNNKLHSTELSKQSYKSKSIKLESEVDSLRKQLDYEQKECKTRHHNIDKLKSKNQKLKVRVLELEKEIQGISNQKQKYKVRVKQNIDYNSQLVQQKQKEILESPVKLMNLRIQQEQINRYKETSRFQKNQIKEYKLKLQECEKKMKEGINQKQSIIQSNQKFIYQLQDSLHKILTKTQQLQKQNNQLTYSFQRVCDQLSIKQKQLDRFYHQSSRRKPSNIFRSRDDEQYE